MDADSNIDKLLSVTHRNIINIFISAFGNSKADIMTKDIADLFVDLKYRREYYSYVTPFNNLFDYEEDLKKLEQILLDCYQLTSFHSLMIEKSYQKNIGKVTRFTNADEIYETGKSRLDSSCEFLRGELLQYGFKPEYIALDLDHQFDEFHTYDGFYHGDSNKEALKITDIWTFVVSALMQAPL